MKLAMDSFLRGARRARRPWSRALLALGGAWLYAASAAAGNEDEFFVGNDAALVGGAVAATVNDGGSLWYNPGGLGDIQRDQLDMTTSVYSVRFYHADDYMRSTRGPSRDISVTDFVTVPTQISYVRLLTDTLSLGLGYYAPRTALLIVDEQLRDSGNDVESEWALDAVSSYSEYALGAGLGFEAAPGLRLGFGALARVESLTESLGFFGSITESNTTTSLLEVNQLRTQFVVGVELIAGAQWDVSDQFSIGLSLRAPRLSAVNSANTASGVGTGTEVDGEIVLFADAQQEDISETSVSIVRLGRYCAGFAYRLPPYTFSADFDIQPDYDNPENAIERKFAWNGRVGVKRDLSQALAVGLGFFTDRSAAEGQEGTLLDSGGNFYGLSAGLQLSNKHDLAPGEPADSIEFTSVFGVRYAYASAATGALLVDPTSETVFSIEQVTMSVHEFGLFVGSGLFF